MNTTHSHAFSRAPGSPLVLFLSSERKPENPSRFYRCENQAKQIRQAGARAEVVFVGDATREQLEAAQVLVFARCRLDERTLSIAREARDAGKVLCGELDDRVFAPWDVATTGYLRSRGTLLRDREIQAGMSANESRLLRLLSFFDVVLVSTPKLKEEVEKLGIPAHVFRNVVDTELVRPIRRTRTALKRILIMSGTRTHDADFQPIAHPLATFLVESPDVRCTLLGSIDVPSVLRGLPNVEKKGLLPMSELYGYIADFDLCLVPLEDSIFNDCKSALKYLECGLVSVPVLASPRAEYLAAVRHGENGFIASDEPEVWLERLREIRDQPKLVERASAFAHEDVLATHTVASRGGELAAFARGLIADRKARREAR